MNPVQDVLPPLSYVNAAVGVCALGFTLLLTAAFVASLYAIAPPRRVR